MIDSAKYRPDIDGLRAIAVLAVVIYHSGFGFSGGYIGVDVFFVISGYLITQIIINGLEAGTFSLADFWSRRVRRIFPASAVLVFSVLAIGYFLLLPDDLQSLGKSAIAQSVFAANIFFWRDTDYFAGPAELKPLLHTWSLAVEEQFYLIYPVLLIALHRSRRLAITPTLTFLFLVSLATCIIGVRRHMDATFFLLPPRAWELLSGGLLASASMTNRLSRTQNELLAWAGLAAIIAPALLYTNETRFPGEAAIPPVFGTAAIILTGIGSHKTQVSRLLSFRPLVLIGLVSYSLYLWHWPIFAFTRYYFWDSPTMILLSILPIAVISALSWKYVETPIRRSSRQWRGGRLVLVATAITALIMCVSITLARSDRIRTHVESRWVSPSAADFERSGSSYQVSDADLLKGQAALLGTRSLKERKHGKFVLLGDSHALSIAQMIDDLAKQHDCCGFSLAANGVQLFCGPSYRKRKRTELRQSAILKFVEEHDVRHAILVARWLSYFPPNNPVTSQEYRIALREFVGVLRAKDIDICVMGQVPIQPASAQLFRVRAFMTEHYPLLFKMPQSNRVDYLSALSASKSAFRECDDLGLHYIDISDDCFDESGLARIREDHHWLYFDDDHLSYPGAQRLVRPAFEDLFRQWYAE